MTSKKKAAANRINGRKSHGPTNTTSTRFNATKHGLLAAGITELDDSNGYRAVLNNLREEKTPVGTVEAVFVESVALDIVRLRRARRFEAEYITDELNPPIHEAELCDLLIDGQMLDPGLPATISFKAIQQLVTLQRYESTFANRLFRTLHELERSQRARQGESLPAPVAVDVDVNVHTDAVIMDSVQAATEQPKALPGDEE